MTVRTVSWVAVLVLLAGASCVTVCRTTSPEPQVIPGPPEPDRPVPSGPDRPSPEAVGPLPELPRGEDDLRAEGEFGERMAAEAVRFLRAGVLEVDGVRFAMSCSELVHAVLVRLGCTGGPSGSQGKGGTGNIHAWCEKEGLLHTGLPLVGDLVIFDNTYDRNRNRSNDDDFTHIGIVTGSLEDGTVRFVHVGSGRVKESHMNLERPGARADSAGNVLNDYVRARKKGDRRGTRYLAGELFRDFCRVPGCAAVTSTSHTAPLTSRPPFVYCTGV